MDGSMTNNTGVQAESHGTPDLQALLDDQDSGHRMRRWWWLLLLLLIAGGVGGYFYMSRQQATGVPQFVTQPVRTETLTVTVTATGNLEPTNQVEVGSELSGRIASVFVDDDDRVTKGQVLAELNTSALEDSVRKAEAAVAVAEASRRLAEATAAEARAKMARYREVARLSNNKVPSQTEMEAAEAELARAEAEVASAKASVAQAEAGLNSDYTNLEKARIKSPINGVVLLRAVDPGQAVAASLQAVTLFTLAEDLAKMELQVDVDEADVGQVQAGQKASFTVDAWPERRFEAEITRVGFNATDTDGVISYPAVLRVSNDDLILRPGMTATAEITTLEHENALVVPNAALRFTPTAPTEGTSSGSGILSMIMPRPPQRRSSQQQLAALAPGERQLWVLRDGQPVALQVTTGATNGQVTEILAGDLTLDDRVIVQAVGAGS